MVLVQIPVSSTLSVASTIPAQLYAALISSSDDAIVLKSLEGVILTWNQGAMRMYGYTPDEAIGQPMAMLCPPERSGEVSEILVKVRSGERISHYETMRRRKDGTIFPVSVSVSPVNDEYGATIGAASIARDITEQSQTRVAAALASQKKDLDIDIADQNLSSFTYSVSHDLRSPLRALAGYSSLLLQECGDALGEEGRDYAARIEAASKQMSVLIDDLLNLSRITRAALHLQTVDLSAEVEDIAGQLQRQEPGRDVHFRIQRLVQVRADPALIRTVLQNLMANAWKFTSHRPGALIEFGTTPTGDAPICYYVRDNGVGFDPLYVSKLFQPFQRLHSVGEFPGTGIGLANVRQIIERHGGHAWAEGKVGEGAAIYFTLDAEDIHRPAGPAGPAGPPGPAGPAGPSGTAGPAGGAEPATRR
jgi:PAS domain S-box-containing protein